MYKVILVDLLRITLGFILVLFIPGYALTWAIFPKKEEKEFVERIALSFVLSITSVMLSVLFCDVILGVDITPENILITILILTISAVVVWRIEMAYINSSFKAKMWDKCEVFVSKINNNLFLWIKKSLTARKKERNKFKNFPYSDIEVEAKRFKSPGETEPKIPEKEENL